MILTNAFGPDVRVLKEAKYLVERGFDVELLCWDREGEYKDRASEEIEGIKIRRFFSYAKYGSGIKQVIPFVKFIQECRDYLKNEKFNYLHCHDLDGIITGYFSRINKEVLIFDMHEFYEVNGKRQKFRYIIRRIVKFFQNKSNYIIYVNKAQTNTVTDKNKIKLVFLPNYPEATHYVGCEKNQSNQLRVSYIGSVRQFEQLKNLFEACKDFEEVLVSIHGAGVHSDKLKQIERNYKNVQVTGKYHFSMSAKLYSECDLLYAVYPMNNIQNKIVEPIKFFESIITKTPIITDKKADIYNLIKEKNIGFGVNGSNVDDIRELIKRVLDNRYVLEQQQENLGGMANDYSWEKKVVCLDKIYCKNN